MASKELIKAETLNAGLVLDMLSGSIDPRSAVFTKPDPVETAKRIAERDANASSAAELFGSAKLIAGKDYTERPFKLTAVDFNEGDFPDSELNVYAVLRGETPQGQSITLGCGATTVMRRAAKAVVEGWLPVWVKIVKGRPNPETGFVSLSLEDASEYAPFDA